MNKKQFIPALLLVLCLAGRTFSQISPGQLASVHAHLEGISNCTQCHTLGNKVTNDKCLNCHTEVKVRTAQNKGYHAIPEVQSKNCIQCHSDHHGANFQIIRFDKTKFDHKLTGFSLTGAHNGKPCNDCHKSTRIRDASVSKKKFTYMGLGRECVNCHTDYHNGTLSTGCSTCHTDVSFKPASKFSHAATDFPLRGMHQTVPCASCHKVTVQNGNKFQQFRIVQFKTCSNCHADPHQNRFGGNCVRCHSEESFHSVKTISNFDHSGTGFILADRHLSVPCQSCHKKNYSDPIPHNQCTDCHQDYHKQQFRKNGTGPDCSDCHSTKGFTGSSFGTDRHNAGPFPLTGAHLATPCTDCHRKQENWNFRNIGIRCNDCHNDIHQDQISSKFYPEKNCQNCHSTENWNLVKFDHATTNFRLEGKHSQQDCRACHFRKDANGEVKQQFLGTGTSCTNCHTDIHFGQFEMQENKLCDRCHGYNYWKIDIFDHDRTAFRLDGRHRDVACNKCHKPVQKDDHTYILYKIKDTRCESCH